MNMMNRRKLLQQGIYAVTSTVMGAATLSNIVAAEEKKPTIKPAVGGTVPLGAGGSGAKNPFVLEPLPYPADALEPHIDARTMTIHHDKHQGAYVEKLNKAIADEPSLVGKSLDDLVTNWPSLPEKARTAVRNNGGGDLNHQMFWPSMAKNGGGAPKDALGKAIDTHFKTYDAFQAELSKAAMDVFGSGWAWLVATPDKKLMIVSTPNQDSPLTTGNIPLVGIDVWEHAYYLKYQNRRADYVKAWFNVVNWPVVAERYQKATA